MTTTAKPVGLWSNTRYLLWLISDTSKGLAASLAGFAIPLITLAVTDDPAQAGIVAGVGVVTRLITTLYGGVLADRHGRLALMLLGAVVATVLAAVFTMMALADALTFATILVIEMLLMVHSGLFDPAGESALKEIVSDATMGRAQAANQGRDAALRLAGGPLGGLLLGVGAWLVGIAMTVAYAVAGATAWMLRGAARRVDAGPSRSAAPSPASALERPSAGHEIRDGFTWLLSRPDLRGVLLLTTIINLGFNAAVTTVVYGLQQSGHSELTIGSMSAGLGAVMLVGAFVAPALVTRVKAGTLTIAGLLTATVGAGVVSAIENPWWITVVLGASVFLLPALNASMMGYFMVATPTELLGRANSAAGVLGMGAMPLAPLIAGFGLTLVGRQSTILFAAALCAVSVVLAVSNRGLRDLPAEAGWAAHAKQFEIL
ncbi:MFS transporter [Microbacterium sp. M28]|uniref:MFS transporter n=1 Tax=Microbacterium sp. M28 TaxID=2962064 RepID=UPI0021F4C772|nr:MFS transporter [Microbacterium sp. M28]UYO96938.1 MFS transporter [Microbacterium sp. M28]